MTIIKCFIPLSKVDEEQRMVFGYASTEALDSQGEVIARAAIEEALPDYMRFANIREMHTMSAVGVAKEAGMTEKGLYVGAKVVDDAAWVKVKEGVYKGFSIGGRGLAKADNVITKMRLTEISLVDRPANPECVFDTWKADSLEDGAVEKAAEDAAAPSADAVQAPSGGQPQEAVAAAPIEKGLWNVQRLVESLGALSDTMRSAEYEARQGEHSQDMIAALRASVANLSEVVKQYLGEEIALILAPQGASAGVTVAMGDGAGDDVAKAGARYSKATKAALSKIHGMLRECDKAMGEMGYESADEDDDANKAEGAGDVGKAEGIAAPLESEVVELAKSAGIEIAEGAVWADLMKAALSEVKALRAENAKLKELPEPPKGVARAVAKGEDTNGNAVLSTVEADPNDPLAVIKAALSRPVIVGA